MELVNDFRVPVSAAEAWKVLTDVERVAPCIPGAQLLSVNGDDFTGAVKVKVGPITVSYQGEATFQEKDEAAQRVVIRANGKETRGSGTASAVVTAQLKDEGAGGTAVAITTDLTISGKAAQFGRGVLADVSSHLIDQFAKNMEADLLGGSSTDAPAAETASAAAEPAAPQDNAINSLALAKAIAPSLAKRYAPVAIGVVAGLAVGLLAGRRRRKRHADDLRATLLELIDERLRK